MSIVFRWGNLKKRNRLEDLVEDGRIILKESSRNTSGRAWTGLIWAQHRDMRRGSTDSGDKNPHESAKFLD
jgi:hypothetical protein